MAAQDLHLVAPSTLVSTRDSLKPVGWANEMQNLPEYPFAQRLMGAGWGEEGGFGSKHTWRMVENAGDPKPPYPIGHVYTAKYEADATELSVPWYRGEDTAAIPKGIIDANQGDAQLIDERDLQKQRATTRIFELQEDVAWRPRSVGQSEYPVSIPMWIPIPGNVTTPGFYNALAAGHTLIAGTDASDSGHPKYRPFLANYSTFGVDDFPVTASLLMRKINFMPIPGTSMTMPGSNASNLMVTMGPKTLAQIELAATRNNDQNGRSISPSFNATSMFGMTPTVSHKVDDLTDAQGTSTSWPIYFLNLTKDGFWPVFQAHGNRFVQDVDWEKAPMSDTFYCHWNWVYAYRVRSRRRLGGMARSAPFGEANI
ncbi:MAG TPA: hypothetical protein VJL29_14570 [Thermoguttaceae bacterium]|nr:hypothetical protein [Thermoguttaceae bacterium]